MELIILDKNVNENLGSLPNVIESEGLKVIVVSDVDHVINHLNNGCKGAKKIVLCAYEMFDFDDMRFKIFQQYPSIIYGMNKKEYCIKSLMNGAKDYITLPFDTDILICKIRAHIAYAI